MTYFVPPGSIVRSIWGKSDTILFIFAGAAAEFALNKAVDWLYFTGKLPADPLGRLFSTVGYARKIVFSSYEDALKAIDGISAVHGVVERKRGHEIPQWAYRDVLFMLIDYSIRSFEVLERKLTAAEKEEVFEVFYRVGERMHIHDLPKNYPDWCIQRNIHLKNDLQKSNYTADLFLQYRKHLGPLRYFLVKEVQSFICPERVIDMLDLRKTAIIRPVLGVYKLSRLILLDRFLKSLLLPAEYKQQVYALDVHE